jgi:hypothetical protein
MATADTGMNCLVPVVKIQCDVMVGSTMYLAEGCFIGMIFERDGMIVKVTELYEEGDGVQRWFGESRPVV